MRLTCPNCGTEYEVPEGLVPRDGKHVQCTDCETRWFVRQVRDAVVSEDQMIERLEKWRPRLVRPETERDAPAADPPRVAPAPAPEPERDAPAVAPPQAAPAAHPEPAIEPAQERTTELAPTAEADAGTTRADAAPDGQVEAGPSRGEEPPETYDDGSEDFVWEETAAPPPRRSAVPPGPSEPAPSEPAPSEPAPSEPGPSEPETFEPTPSEPAPSEPAPVAAAIRVPPAPPVFAPVAEPERSRESDASAEKAQDDPPEPSDGTGTPFFAPAPTRRLEYPVREPRDAADDATDGSDGNDGPARLRTRVRRPIELPENGDHVIMEPEPPLRRGRFGTGLAFALALFALALAAYVWRDGIGRAVPVAGPALDGYAERIDGMREWADGVVGPAR